MSMTAKQDSFGGTDDGSALKSSATDATGADVGAEMETLRGQVEDLQEILEGSFDGILVTDVDGTILYVNSSYERVAEIDKKDMEGKKMRDLINPVWMPQSVAYVVAEKKETVTKRQVTKSGRHIVVTGRPLFDKKGNIKKIVINVRDISEIYLLTEELLYDKGIGALYLKGQLDFSDCVRTCGGSVILAASREMQGVLTLAEKVSAFRTTVLITGESGVGKEEVAKFIHNNGTRRESPFIVVNCGAIPVNLLESELFGHEKGAFTGAMQTGKSGLLEAADGGTVFLDEIGETSLDFQVKLLRFLESKEVRRVGATGSNTLDVRVIAATNRDLGKMVEEGTFREDLYYRLNVIQIDVPPLRKRPDDIVPLASLFLQTYNGLYGQRKQLTYEVMKELERCAWVGNVRQLKNVIENMVIISNNDYLQTEDLPWVTRTMANPVNRLIDIAAESLAFAPSAETTEDFTFMSLADATEYVEKLLLQRAKETCGTTVEMAKRLKVNQSTIVRKLQKYGL
ncbi:MAG: sigma 54-interacting transcriptional regulator [Clostridiales Family XIII bacterium]|jgi:PAS domain S-box-containing protein|nr:sigma 54-interacting transcriptional regulator [Clostridiales Family XIII bacterium]